MPIGLRRLCSAIAPDRRTTRFAERMEVVGRFPQADARTVLSRPLLDSRRHTGVPKTLRNADQMRALRIFLRRFPIRTAHKADASLCGSRGYKPWRTGSRALAPRGVSGSAATANWRVLVPNESIIRDCLTSVDPEALGHTLQQCNAVYGQTDDSLAIDGKSVRIVIDEQGRRTCIMSVVGHQTMACYVRKKVCTLPIGGDAKTVKQTNEIKTAIPYMLLMALGKGSNDRFLDSSRDRVEVPTADNSIALSSLVMVIIPPGRDGIQNAGM